MSAMRTMFGGCRFAGRCLPPGNGWGISAIEFVSLLLAGRLAKQRAQGQRKAGQHILAGERVLYAERAQLHAGPVDGEHTRLGSSSQTMRTPACSQRFT